MALTAEDQTRFDVAYELTRDDLYALQWRAAHVSSVARRSRRNAYIYLLLAVVLIAIVPAIGGDGFVISRVSFGFIAIGFPLVAGLMWVLEQRMLRRTILKLLEEEKQDKGQLGKHSMTLTEDGLVESTVVGESRNSWAGIHRVEQNPDYIFLYTAPIAAHLVPKRAFNDPGDADRFFEFARSRWSAANQPAVR